MDCWTKSHLQSLGKSTRRESSESKQLQQSFIEPGIFIYKVATLQAPSDRSKEFSIDFLKLSLPLCLVLFLHNFIPYVRKASDSRILERNVRTLDSCCSISSRNSSIVPVYVCMVCVYFHIQNLQLSSPKNPFPASQVEGAESRSTFLPLVFR